MQMNTTVLTLGIHILSLYVHKEGVWAVLSLIPQMPDVISYVHSLTNGLLKIQNRSYQDEY